MNKIIKSSVLLLTPFMLSSCSLMSSVMERFTYKEVEYEEFHEKSEKAWDDIPYVKAVVNGKLTMKKDGITMIEQYENIEVTVKDGYPVVFTTDSEAEIQAAYYVYANASFVLNYDDVDKSGYSYANLKYYVSSTGGFKLVEELRTKDGETDVKTTMKFDKYAMMTSMSVTGTVKGSITIKYS